MFMQHAGVQKAKGTVDFWKATLVSQSMKCGLCRGPCKGNGKHLLNISIRSNNVNGEMYFLAYPLLTSIHVDIIPKGSQQRSRREGCLWKSKWFKCLAQRHVSMGGH